MKQLPDFIKLESKPCPNGCQDESIKVLEGFDRLHHLPGIFSVYKCLGCGLERTDPRPTTDAIGFYYPSDYAPYYDNQTRIKSPTPVKNWLFEKLGLKDKQLPKRDPGRMLEIGCASGNYMELMREGGWHVEGIEFSPEAAKQAINKGFNIQVGAVETAEPPEKPFDLIVGWMVLEHLHKPIEVLNELRMWMKPDGYLLLSVPDKSSINRRLFGELSYDLQLPTHLYHFDRKSIKLTLTTAGWSVERIFWQRNCNTFMMSCQYWAEDRRKEKILRLVQWVRTANSAKYIRLMLSVVLGFTKQSGRMEVWARPVKTDASGNR